MNDTTQQFKELAGKLAALQSVKAPETLSSKIDRSISLFDEKEPLFVFPSKSSLARALALSVMATLILGTAAAAFFENSMPGDLLYPVKQFVKSIISSEEEKTTLPPDFQSEDNPYKEAPSEDSLEDNMRLPEPSSSALPTSPVSTLPAEAEIEIDEDITENVNDLEETVSEEVPSLIPTVSIVEEAEIELKIDLKKDPDQQEVLDAEIGPVKVKLDLGL